MSDGFVYIWFDSYLEKYYIGSHKGTTDDGYICSSKTMLKEYKNRPQHFSRTILASGPYIEMRQLETEMLVKVDAAKNRLYYNKANSDGKFYNTGPQPQTAGDKNPAKRPEVRAKMSIASKGRKQPPRTDEYRAKISERQLGKKFSEERKANISRSKLGKKIKPCSDEHREKLREAGKRRWQKQKCESSTACN